MTTAIIPDPLSEDVIHIAPSNNMNTDTYNFEKAIEKLSYSTASMRQGKITTSGRYFFNKPLVFGNPDDKTIRSIDVEGLSQSEFTYYGPKHDGYLLSFYGIGRNRTTRLKNIFVNCGFRSRGVLMSLQTYTRCLVDVYVLYARQVGIDLVGCWGSSMQNSIVVDSRGILYRSTSGSMSLYDCRFAGWGLWYGDGLNVAKNIEINKYEMANGIAATKAFYGSNYSEDWPAVDDTTVKLYDGTFLQTRDDQRAACVVGSGPQFWTNPIWESCYYGARPLMYSQGPFLNIQNTRFEGNYANVKWVLDGNNITLGKCCQYNGVHMADPAVYADCILELRNNTNAVTVDNVCATYLKYAVVRASSGKHTKVKVNNVLTWGTQPPRYRDTICSSGAIIELAR
jgi:hypothetical protein